MAAQTIERVGLDVLITARPVVGERYLTDWTEPGIHFRKEIGERYCQNTRQRLLR